MGKICDGRRECPRENVRVSVKRGIDLHDSLIFLRSTSLRNDLLRHAAVTKDKSPRSRQTTEGFLLCAGPGLRSAQRAISRRMVALLNSTVKAPALAPDGPQDADVTLLPALP
jgi:hypothetical protein